MSSDQRGNQRGCGALPNILLPHAFSGGLCFPRFLILNKLGTFVHLAKSMVLAMLKGVFGNLWILQCCGIFSSTPFHRIFVDTWKQKKYQTQYLRIVTK